MVKRGQIALAMGFLLAISSMKCNTARQTTAPGGTLIIQRLAALDASGGESDVAEIEVCAWTSIAESMGVATVVNPADNDTGEGQVVTLSRYLVSYTRDDGKNEPGDDVPYPFESQLEATIGPQEVVPISLILVRATALTERPLVLFCGSGEYDFRGTINVTLSGWDLSGTPVRVAAKIPCHVFGRGRRETSVSPDSQRLIPKQL